MHTEHFLLKIVLHIEQIVCLSVFFNKIYPTAPSTTSPASATITTIAPPALWANNIKQQKENSNRKKMTKR